MKENKNKSIIVEEIIQGKIHIIKDEKVMLDLDLAYLYQVEIRTLNQAVKRNIDRFPSDFMFQLNNKEESNLRSQIAISSYGGRRYKTFAFTEQGIAMLSSVLKSPRAIQVNIQIMRTFTKMRQMLSSQTELKKKIMEMESKYDQNFKVVFDAIQLLMEEEEKPRKEIGFEAL